ncbi:MAG: carboxypeptidase-like regulatory domain-containing protein [Planctomycetes bacterium]|nr:carboxypeptidase-like regulatory domain-containing protein [Planctomycetota bacterium]
MSKRGRAGPWILLGVAVAIAAAFGWLVFREPAPVAVVGIERPEERAAATPPPKLVEPPKATLESVAVADDERATFTPAGAADLEPPPLMELELRGSEGQPLVGAVVAVFDTKRVLESVESDARGIATVRAGAGRARALVQLRGSAPWLAEFEFAPVRLCLDEPRRLALFGRARVDRTTPSEALELTLTSDRALFDAATIPQALRDALELDARATTRLVTSTDEHGEFVFRGLVEPFTGRLSLPDRVAVLSVEPPSATVERRSVRFAERVERLELELVALPKLVGRVVEADGSPVARADIEGWLVFAPQTDGGGRRGGRGLTASLDETRTDADGRFELLLELPRNLDTRELANAAGLPPTERVGLLVRRNAQSAQAEVEIAATKMRSRWDLGEVVLSAPQERELVVRGPDQKPIEGAVVLFGDAEARTDGNGAAKLAHVEDADTASVGKLGFLPEEVSLEGEGRIEVELRATNRWNVTFVDANGVRVAERRFSLSARGPLFVGDDPTRPSRVHVASGGTDSERAFRERESGAVVATFRTDADGRASFSGFAGPFTLRITDGLGAVLTEREVALGPDEVRDETIELAQRGGTFAGRVVDEFDTSLAGASVRLAVRSARTSETRRTDAAGEFRFEDLQPGRVRLEIEREGFSPLAIDDYELALDGEPIEFRLHTAGTLAVEVIDDLGNAVPTAGLRVRASQHPNLPVRRRAMNRFELRELPGDPVTLLIDIGGREYERVIDAQGGDTRVIVPRHGRAQVTFAPTGELLAGGEYRVRVRSTEPGSEVQVVQLVRTQRAPFTATFDALLPGSYSAQLEWRELSDRDGRTRRTLGTAQAFIVNPNANARVQVGD